MTNPQPLGTSRLGHGGLNHLHGRYFLPKIQLTFDGIYQDKIENFHGDVLKKWDHFTRNIHLNQPLIIFWDM